MEPRVNRTEPRAFINVLDDAIERNRRSGRQVGLLVVSLEQFARVVSAFSYRAGDSLISELAQRLMESARAQDTVVRIGDSKFAVIVDQILNEGHLVLAANKLSQVSEPPVLIEDTTINPEVRVGAALCTDEHTDAEKLLKQAEAALLESIDNAEPYALYAPGQKDRVRDLLGMQREIDSGLGLGEFEVYFQPKVSVSDWHPAGAEALLRWNSAKRGIVSPDEFIAMADQSHRIHALTDFVLHSALRQVTSHSEYPDGLSMSVNVTPSTLEHEEFVDGVISAMGLWSVGAGRLTVEVTESAIMRNPDATFHSLKMLREQGARVSIDDFGTGYSSLSYFRDIPADEIKIDKSFVMNMLNDPGNTQIVQTIIELAHGFGLAVVAEGVETQEIANALGEMGCDYLQGFLFARPMPQEEFVVWLNAATRRGDRAHPIESRDHGQSSAVSSSARQRP